MSRFCVCVCHYSITISYNLLYVVTTLCVKHLPYWTYFINYVSVLPDICYVNKNTTTTITPRKKIPNEPVYSEGHFR